MASNARGPGAVVGSTEASKKKTAPVKSKPDNSQAHRKAQPVLSGIYLSAVLS
jgi:hypothetical protein